MNNWLQSPKARKAEKSSDDATTNGDLGVFVLRDDVAWPENVKDDGQRATAAGNWRMSPDAEKTRKKRVTTRDKRRPCCVRSLK